MLIIWDSPEYRRIKRIKFGKRLHGLKWRGKRPSYIEIQLEEFCQLKSFEEIFWYMHKDLLPSVEYAGSIRVFAVPTIVLVPDKWTQIKNTVDDQIWAKNENITD